MTDLVRQHEPSGVAGGPLTPSEFEFLSRVGRALAASGLFRDAEQEAEAFAKVLLGRDLGLSPTQAMTAIHVVEGKPELSANLQAAMIRNYRGPDGERYDYRVLELSDEAVELEFLRDGKRLGSERFTRADAQRAGLWDKKGKNGTPGVWQRYPRNMLYARAISNGVAFYCPEITFGTRVYGPGELSGDEDVRADQVHDIPDDAAGPLDPPDADVVDPAPDPGPEPDDPEPEPRSPGERIVAAYVAAGRPAGPLRAALEAENVPLDRGLHAAVLSVRDDATADRIAAALHRHRSELDETLRRR